MITDAIPWKEDLLKIADRLERKRHQRRWTERSSYLVERDITLGAYAVRRLIEASKVSTPLVGSSVAVQAFPLLGERIPDLWTKFCYWELYDVEAPQRENLSLKQTCNQIIHSWMWSLSAPEEGSGFDGIYIASDKTRETKLYFIAIEKLVEIFQRVGNETSLTRSSCSMTMVR